MSTRQPSRCEREARGVEDPRLVVDEEHRRHVTPPALRDEKRDRRPDADLRLELDLGRQRVRDPLHDREPEAEPLSRGLPAREPPEDVLAGVGNALARVGHAKADAARRTLALEQDEPRPGVPRRVLREVGERLLQEPLVGERDEIGRRP